MFRAISDASTSPATTIAVRAWSRDQVLAVGALLAVLAGVVLTWDMAVARLISAHGLPGDARRLIRLCEVFGWGGTVALIIATAAVLDSRGRRVAVSLAAGAFGAGLMADGMKLLVARLRPSAADLHGPVLDTFVAWLPLMHADSLGQRYGYAVQSFPSGHAATAAGLAVMLAAHYPRGRWLFAAFALLAAMQRIEAQAHYASDVLAGAAIGCIVAAITTHLLTSSYRPTSEVK